VKLGQLLKKNVIFVLSGLKAVKKFNEY